ncbi:MAG: DUF1232 domain-containing protein, partial [Acidobacteria bacterium]|nr:DUF1232 domain-containing protein [Acidobacteriota bacterium]
MKRLLLLLPNLLKLLYRLLKDPRVSREDKIILGATVAYVVTPLDFVPDFIPFFGQVDDAYLVALALLRLLNRTDEAILREHWDGPEDL